MREHLHMCDQTWIHKHVRIHEGAYTCNLFMHVRMHVCKYIRMYALMHVAKHVCRHVVMQASM